MAAGVSVVAFALVHLSGDPVRLMVSTDAPTNPPLLPSRSRSRMMNSSRRFSILPSTIASILSFLATFLTFLSDTAPASSSSAVPFHLSVGTTVCVFLISLTSSS